VILEGKPYLRRGNDDCATASTYAEDLAHGGIEIHNMFKDFETSYEREEFVWEIDLLSGHQQNLKIRPQDDL